MLHIQQNTFTEQEGKKKNKPFCTLPFTSLTYSLAYKMLWNIF